MITFRYHLVSIIAVFLSLALGVVVGSTLIDRAIVDGLNAQVDDVQARLDERKSEVDRLRKSLEGFETYTDETAPWAVDGRLSGTSVVVVAERGVSRELLERTVELARAGGAVTPGIYWLNEGWSLEDDALRGEVADGLGVRNGEASAVRARAWREVINDLGTATVTDAEADEAASQESTTTSEPATDPTATDSTATDPTATDSTITDSDVTDTTVTEPDPDDSQPVTQPSTGAIATLADLGVLEFEAVGPEGLGPLDLQGGRLRILLVGSPASDVAAGRFLDELMSLNLDESVPTLVAEAFEEIEGGPERGSVVSVIRGDDALAARVSTVDDLDLTQGQVAAILGLAEAGRGVVGHYGYGEGATGIVPQWPGPAG